MDSPAGARRHQAVSFTHSSSGPGGGGSEGFDWLLFITMSGGGFGFQWLFHAEQAAHVGHKLLQALEECHLLLAVHGGRRAAGRQLVEGVGQPLVDDGVSLRRQQRLHQLRVLRLVEDSNTINSGSHKAKTAGHFILKLTGSITESILLAELFEISKTYFEKTMTQFIHIYFN